MAVEASSQGLSAPPGRASPCVEIWGTPCPTVPTSLPAHLLALLWLRPAFQQRRSRLCFQRLRGKVTWQGRLQAPGWCDHRWRRSEL